MYKPYISAFLELIPPTIDSTYLQSPSDFSRDRKLPFDKLVTLVLSLSSDANNKGVEIKCGDFFRMCRRSGLWPDAESVHRSAVTKGRKKIPWQVFEEISDDAVALAYELWPQDDEYNWNGRAVYAFDGAKFLLPATSEIRNEFDPNSGLESDGKGHYPQCLVTTAYDVFRRMPIGRVVSPCDSSEREVVRQLIPKIPAGSLLLFDSGYPGFKFFKYLNNHYQGDYVFRSPATKTFLAVQEFIVSQNKEDVIDIAPPTSYIYRCESDAQREERKNTTPIRLRVIRLENPDGTLSVLLTNLLDCQKYPIEEVIKLYFKRWEIETFYRHEKAYIQLEKFHSRSVNGILQELFASLIVSIIAAVLMVIAYEAPNKSQSKGPLEKSIVRLQFKNAVMAVAAEAAFLASRDPARAVEILVELLKDIRKVKYYKPKVPRRMQPRVSLKPTNKWTMRKQKRMDGEYDA